MTEKKKRTINSFFDKTVQPKKQRTDTIMTKDGTGAGTFNNNNPTAQSTVMTQATTTTIHAETTTEATHTNIEMEVGTAKRAEAIIHRRNKTPLATHIKNRITKVIGKTITESLTALVMTNKGTQTRYKKADLEYDKRKQFITLQDTIQTETTKRKTTRDTAPRNTTNHKR